MTDVIVVGGGPAGTSLAIALGRRGHTVELYEQATFPRDKACGEGLLPAGRRVLRRLGLEAAVGGEPLLGVRHHVGGGALRSAFGGPGSDAGSYGLGQRRLRFDAALWDVATRTPHVSAHQGTRVDTVLVERGRVSGVVIAGEPRRAGLVVAADGSRSLLRQRLGLERPSAPRRVGIRAHYRRPAGAARLTDIEIFLRSGYELYVTPLPHGEVLVAALARHDVAAGDLRGHFERWVGSERALREWLDGAEPTSELMGRAPLVIGTRACEPPGLILLGDAAASVDPITAGGLSLALESAELLAGDAGNLLAGSPLARRRFERTRARMLRSHRLLGASILALAARPRLTEVARRALTAYPAALHALVELAGGR